MEMFDETIISLPDERGFALAREMEAKASINQAEVKGLIRVVRKLGHVLKQVDPNHEYLKRKKIDEVYKDTKLEIPSPFK